jgi:hypothetical protein
VSDDKPELADPADVPTAERMVPVSEVVRGLPSWLKGLRWIDDKRVVLLLVEIPAKAALASLAFDAPPGIAHLLLSHAEARTIRLELRVDVAGVEGLHAALGRVLEAAHRVVVS